MQKIDNNKHFTDFSKAWAKTLPPTRPSAKDLEVYKGLLKKYRNQESITKIMILGATPELRDLASRFYAQVTVIDANKQMIDAMTGLRRYATPENIIISRWQKLSLKTKQNIVIGDTILNMLNRNDISRVIRKVVAEVLAPNGYFWHRTAMYSPKKNVKTMPVIKDWRNKKIDIGDVRWLIGMYSKYKSYNPLTQIDDKEVFIDNIKKLYFEGLITKAEFNRFCRYDDKVKLTIFKKSEWEQLFSKAFKIKKIITPQGHLYSKDMPIFVCQKK